LLGQGLCLLGALLLAGALALWPFTKADLDYYFQRALLWAYWAGLVQLLWLSSDLWRHRAPRATLSTAFRACVLPLLLTVIIFCPLDTEYRILADETNNLGTSLSMYLNGR